MKIDLTGKTAAVTGSSAGIGWGCARGVADAGATVVITGRNAESLARARTRILDAAPEADIRRVVTDLSTAPGCAALVEAEAEATCDIRGQQSRGIRTETLLRGERLFKTDVMSGIRLSRAYLPALMHGAGAESSPQLGRRHRSITRIAAQRLHQDSGPRHLPRSCETRPRLRASP